MKIRKTIVDSEKENRIDVLEIFKYNTDFEVYKSIFLFLEKCGYIEAESYEALSWELPCEVKLRKYTITFDLNENKEMNNVLRSYILVRRSSGLMPASCYRYIQRLKKIITLTNGFRDLKKLEIFLNGETKTNAWEYAIGILNFCDFYFEKYDEIKRICKSIPREKHGSRQLPSFIEVLRFDELIDKLLEKGVTENIYQYYPIIIWWKLTSVIPMRPVDFFTLKYNCLEINGIGSYSIKFTRSKIKSNKPSRVNKSDKVEISKEMYKLINEYRNVLIRLNIESQYLFSYEFYNKYTVIDHSNSRNIESERIGDVQFSNLLTKFYNEIVLKQIGLLDKITAGDTRHFAIINLFLQGYSPLSIARLAGHEYLEASNNYYSHAVHYAESYTYHLAQNLHESSISEKIGFGFTKKLREAVDRGRVFNEDELKKYKKVKYGYCRDLSDDFPMNCVEDCRVCDFYMFKPSINNHNEALKWLELLSENQKKEMDKTLNFMYSLSLEKNYNVSNLTINSEVDNTLKSNSKKLFSLMERQALIQSKILEESSKNDC